VVTAAKKGIGALCKFLRKWAPQGVFCKAVIGIILPAFMYAVEVWYPPGIREQSQLERILKYAAGLILNDFSNDTQYESLLKEVKWKPLFRLVAERRLLLIKKYLDGRRFIPESVFSLEPECVTRHSQRIEQRRKKHCLILEEIRSSNSLEEKLSAAQMRKLWNSLEEETVRLPVAEFRRVVQKDEIYQTLVGASAISTVWV
jgi:hypothetical protein